MATLLRDYEWQKQASCSGLDPEMFFPTNTDRPNQKYAKAVCKDCPVQPECLEFGISERYGIWGGLTEKERRAVRRFRRRTSQQNLLEVV